MPKLVGPTTDETSTTVVGAVAGAAGAPTTGTAVVGQQYVDAAGTLWVCLTAGTPGIWQRGKSAASRAFNRMSFR